MEKLALLFVIVFIIAGCTSSQFTTYRPAGSNEANWQINVLHTSGVTENFKVVINDSTVIDESANLLSGALEKKTKYKDKEIKLIVSHSSGFLGAGSSYEAMVFISNELAAIFKF